MYSISVVKFPITLTGRCKAHMIWDQWNLSLWVCFPLQV